MRTRPNSSLSLRIESVSKSWPVMVTPSSINQQLSEHACPGASGTVALGVLRDAPCSQALTMQKLGGMDEGCGARLGIASEEQCLLLCMLARKTLGRIPIYYG